LIFSQLIVSVSVFILCFQFLLDVSCSSINEMLCTVCSLNAFVLFDESKEGEKLKNGKLIKIGLE